MKHFLAITHVSLGWLIQPCARQYVGSWIYEKPIAGPFKTRKEARKVRKLLEWI